MVPSTKILIWSYSVSYSVVVVRPCLVSLLYHPPVSFQCFCWCRYAVSCFLLFQFLVKLHRSFETGKLPTWAYILRQPLLKERVPPNICLIQGLSFWLGGQDTFFVIAFLCHCSLFNCSLCCLLFFVKKLTTFRTPQCPGFMAFQYLGL